MAGGGVTGLATLTTLVAAWFVLQLARATRRRAPAFWPPATPQQACHVRWVFRAMVYPLAAASGLYVWQNGLVLWGLALFVPGFGIAFGANAQMGWAKAFGHTCGLITNGAFRYSRNPVYVATWPALLGWAICTPHPLIWSTLALWAYAYVLAIRLEEPWMRAADPVAWDAYAAQTPRYLRLWLPTLAPCDTRP